MIGVYLWVLLPLFYGSNRDLGDIDILIRSDMAEVAKLFGVFPIGIYKGLGKAYLISFVSHGIEVEMGNILILDYLKSDINDIIGILNNQNIDWSYFIERVDQMNAKEAVFSYVVNRKLKYRGKFVIDQIEF